MNPLLYGLFAWCMPGLAQANDASQVSHSVDVITEAYGGQIDAAQLYRAALDGMARELDILTGRAGHAVLTQSDRQQVEAWFDGSRHGIAAEFTIVAGQGIVITDVYAGGPAETAGLSPGDLIVAMDDRPFTGLPAELILTVAADIHSQQVVLDVQRPEGLRRIPITRGSWRLDTARLVTHQGVAVLRLPFFGPGSAAAVQSALSDHPADAPLVIDLRTNEGGRPSAMAQVAALFVEPGSAVAMIDESSGAQRVLRAQGTPPIESVGSIVLLVDRDTGGTAEAFAASLRHHRGALLVGSPTAGQDGIPSWSKLENGLYLQLIADGIRGPDGRSWAPDGMVPDVLSQPVGRPMPVTPGELPADVQLDAACHVAVQTPAHLSAGH